MRSRMLYRSHREMIARSLIIILGVFLALGPALTFGNDPAVSKKELQRIKREMRAKQKEIKQADKKEQSILTDLERMDREIQAGKAELADRQKRLLEAEIALKDVEKNNTEINRELDGLKQAYSRRVRALYKMNKAGSPVLILLSQGEGDKRKLIKYMSMITERDRAIIQEYGTALDALADRQARIAEKSKVLVERKRTLEIKKSQFEAGKKRKAVLLASVRKKKNLSEQALQELEESSASLWAMIKKAEQERTVAKPSRPPAPPAAASVMDGKSLPWPIRGRVLTRFGMQRHPELKTMVFRRGIEISAQEGEAVRAVGDGQVAYADWFKGYGKLMIIEHGPGFYTLYGNLSRLDLHQGDRAVRGQVIGLAGDTGSLKGSKLYFEVRRNGEAQDPLSLLAGR